MLFNSIEFTIFYILLFILYWFITNKNLKAQNILLLVASYFFYFTWDWRFLFLLASLSLVNYLIGIELGYNENAKRKKALLTLGLIVNIVALGFFKYFNFFIDGFIDFVSMFGYILPKFTTKIILPVGISFYVFLSLSYLIDVNNKNLQPQKNIVNLLLTLSFFPIILAGPIHRPALLLPQIAKRRDFNNVKAVDGLKQILWGLFAKTVIADNLSRAVDNIFPNYSDYSGSTLLLIAIYFTVQIYADFSGYSNIAIGISKLMGFDIMQNFNYPYFSRDITEFWKRWHISLTFWFRDYVFLPLSFAFLNRIQDKKAKIIRTDLFIYISVSIIVWLLTGLWHGANYTFILWGLMHGFLLIIYHIQRNPRRKLLKKLGINNNKLPLVVIETTFTISLIVLTWIFFRSPSTTQAIDYINGIFSPTLFTIPRGNLGYDVIIMGILMLLYFVFEWFGRKQQYALDSIGKNYGRPIRYALYYLVITLIVWFGGSEQQFIYLQF